MIYTNMNNSQEYFIRQISTLKIYSYKENITKLESYYLEALEYLFNHLKTMKDNNLCLYLGKNTFLIANNDNKNKINPFAFVNKKGDILFKVNIRVFDSVIQDFKQYIYYYNKQQEILSEEQIIKLAINDYKNDKLDFYSNSKIISQNLINKAKEQYYIDNIEME